MQILKIGDILWILGCVSARISMWKSRGKAVCGSGDNYCAIKNKKVIGTYPPSRTLAQGFSTFGNDENTLKTRIGIQLFTVSTGLIIVIVFIYLSSLVPFGDRAGGCTGMRTPGYEGVSLSDGVR